MATGLSVAKTLLNIQQQFRENEEVKEPIDLEFTEQKTNPEMMKLLLTLSDWMYKKKTRKIQSRLTTLRACKSKLTRNFFSKK